MGRGRGKGKKQVIFAARDDAQSGEDGKIPSRRRGRPQKPLKDDIEEEDDVEKIEDEENAKIPLVNNKSSKNQAGTENGRKRIRPSPSPVKENADLVKDKNGVGIIESNTNELIKSVGFRPIRSRRKNKPRRAAEVGVECR